jgi:iron-sulfur cluster repair protein YtfE (RIC family)
MNDTTATTNATGAAARPRLDVFGRIHRGIRFALCDLLLRMGRGESWQGELEDVLLFCEGHLAHEERFLRPALSSRQKGPLTTFDKGHPEHTRFVAELRALAKNAAEVPAARRASLERTLYLHYSAFVANNLAHMAEEEQVLQPLLERLFSDEELLAIHGKMMSALTAEERALAARYLFAALDREERIALASAAFGTSRPDVSSNGEAVAQ